MNAKNVHEIQNAIRRTINGNLDGSIDLEQVRHIIWSATHHAVSDQDILVACKNTIGRTVDGVRIELLIQQSRHGARKDN